VKTVLVILALICAVIAAAVGFDVVTNSHVLGWLSAAVALWLGSLLVP